MIEVHQEPEGAILTLHEKERCCFCRKPTRFWTRTDVACCPECASRAHPEDLPSKRQWCRRERVADHSRRAQEELPLKPPADDERQNPPRQKDTRTDLQRVQDLLHQAELDHEEFSYPKGLTINVQSPKFARISVEFRFDPEGNLKTIEPGV